MPGSEYAAILFNFGNKFVCRICENIERKDDFKRSSN